MKPVYEIKFLGSDDFDKLPVSETNGADISDSLGFYNPLTNKVFIRHTAIPELDKYLLDHEFEHLVEDEATDVDECGIRHKKARDIFRLFWDPRTLVNPTIGRDERKAKNAENDAAIEAQKQQEQAAQQQRMLSSFGGLGMGLPGSGQSTPTFGSSQNPFSDQQSTQGSLNQGLNSQSINPLSDPYARFGRSSGRLYF